MTDVYLSDDTLTQGETMSKSQNSLRGAGALTALLAAGAMLAGCAQPASNPGESAPASAAPAVTADPTESSAPTGELTVVVTEATLVDGSIEARAVVTGHIGEGTCEATATSASGTTITTTADAVPDAQSTSCPLMVLEGAGEGEWNVVVTYTGDGVSGTSEATPAEAI